MVTKEFSEALTEINKILSYFPTEYVEKIPKKLRTFFLDVESKEYKPNIDPYKQLDEQVLKPKTKTILTIIYRNYWCNEQERAELDKILIENDKKYEEELREKYNPDNIFKKNVVSKEIEDIEETNLVVYDNKTIYQKVYEFLSNIFKKIFKN